MNQSLSQGVFPTDWKQAKVTPVYKSGATNNTNNYRPISVLPILSKLLERFVHTHLSSFLEENNLLTIVQSGFRRLHSTLTSLIHVTDKWLRNIEKGLVTGVVFIDLRKAFDTVDFSILEKKLHGYGVQGTELQWFSSYLQGRTQVVSIDGELSEPLPVTVGVPQGSILGPLLFLLYVNDLPDVPLKCNTNMYADDTELDYATKPSDLQIMETVINEDLSRLETYFEHNKLSLNVAKCEFLVIGTQQQVNKCNDISIKMCNTEVKNVHSAKYLGMTIDRNIKWDIHTDKLKNKISSKVALLQRLKKIVPIETLKQLYDTIVLPHFDYCDIIYGQCSDENLEKLQKLQNRAARILTGSGPQEHREDMFTKLKWLSLANRQQLHKCVMVYKALNGLAPPYIRDSFVSNSQVHSYRTRNCNKLNIKPYKKEYYAKSFEISGARTYNNLPENVTCATSLNIFKSQLEKHLLTLPQF